MRSGGLSRCFKSARLVGDDRLFSRKAARGRHEPASVLNRLDIQNHGIGRLATGTMIDQLTDRNVQHVADRDEMGEPHLVLERPIEHRGAKRSRLRDEGQASRRRHRVGKAGVELEGRDHHAQAVRADDPHPVELAAGLFDPRFQSLSLFAGFAKAGRNHDQAPDPGVSALADDLGNGVGRGADDRQIDRFRQIADLGERPLVENPLVLRIHRKDRAFEAGVQQVPHHGPPDTGRFRAGTDDRNVTGSKDLVEVAY